MLFFNEDRAFQFGKVKFLERDGGDGYTAVWVYLMTLSCTFKNG